jgi:hypothetical protein
MRPANFFAPAVSPSQTRIATQPRSGVRIPSMMFRKADLPDPLSSCQRQFRARIQPELSDIDDNVRVATWERKRLAEILDLEQQHGRPMAVRA